MTTLLVATDRELLTAHGANGRWTAEVTLDGVALRGVAVDPRAPATAYAAANDGVWRTADGGRSWAQTNGPANEHVMAVAVSRLERIDRRGVVYAGTEPSAVFRSTDGGDRWARRDGLLDLASSDEWSFPPQPDTHHVRWITADPWVAGRLFVAIEAGALVRSTDGGASWQDRVPGGPYDTHTLVTHRLAPNRVYVAAGDGYFESPDGGDTWLRPREGLAHHYLWSVAVDPDDPDTVVVSAARGAREAHNAQHAESHVYRRAEGEPWRVVTDGLPRADGTTATVLAAHRAEPAVFYGANNRGLFRSADAGSSWERIDVAWPEAYRTQRIRGLAVADADGQAGVGAAAGG